MNTIPPAITVESLEKLWDTIKNGTGFNLDQIIDMAAFQMDLAEDFLVVHKGSAYVLPLGGIVQYFSHHPRPAKRLSPEAENAILKKELEILRKELELQRGAETKEATADDAFALEATADATPAFERANIPKRESLPEVQARLAEEVKGMSPARKPKGSL